MKKTFTLLALSLALSFGAQAQPDFQWARQMGGTSNEKGLSIAVDAVGNVYTTGWFRGIADFDPGTGTYNLTSAGDNDIFISKLDASGNFVWAKRIGGTGSDVGYSIALDASGNVYTTGYFQGTVDFDPGAGTYNLTSPTGNEGVFISKLDASGNFAWAKQFTGASPCSSWGYSIAADASGNVYTTGTFNGTVDFDPGAGGYNLTSGTPGHSNFISKLDASGNFIWAKQLSGTTLNPSIGVDAAGNVYTAGNFQGTVDFDSGAGTYNLTVAGSVDIYISKLDATGNFVWAKQLSGPTSEVAFSIALDAVGNVYTTGRFTGTVDFDPGTGGYNLTSAGDNDIFISKLDASGNFVWAKQMGGTSGDIGFSITLDVSGNVYTTGYFQGTADFDPGAGTYNLTVEAGSSTDIFISKLDASGNFVWAKGMGGKPNNDEGGAVAVDASGNVYTTGRFNGTVDFDPGAGIYNLTATGGDDIFVHKLGACANSGSLVITAVRDTICAGTPGVLNVAGNPGSIQWQSSVTAGSFKNISGAVSAGYISQDTVSTYFRVYSSGLCGTDTSATFQLVVKPSPVADFTSNGAGMQFTFTDKSKGATVYNWDFGDNATSTAQNPVHTYASTGTYHVCLTVSNGSNCSFTICRDIDITTGVTNISAKNNLSIYPNPFSNSITIEQRHTNNPIQSIEIYDLLGRKVYEQFQTSNLKFQTINLSGLANSMYFVKVKTKNADYIERVIKQQ